MTRADGSTFSWLTPKLLQRERFEGSGDVAAVGTLVWEGSSRSRGGAGALPKRALVKIGMQLDWIATKSNSDVIIGNILILIQMHIQM
jgi:hypothetical protein